MNVSEGVAVHAAAVLAFANDKLKEVGAFLVQLVLAFVFVNLVDLIMATLEADQAFKTHLVGWQSRRCAAVLLIVGASLKDKCGCCCDFAPKCLIVN